MPNKREKTASELAFWKAWSARNLLNKLIHLVREANGLEVRVRP